MHCESVQAAVRESALLLVSVTLLFTVFWILLYVALHALHILYCSVPWQCTLVYAQHSSCDVPCVYAGTSDVPGQ